MSYEVAQTLGAGHGHLIGSARGITGLGVRGHMSGPGRSAEGTHSDARLPAHVQSKAVVLATFCCSPDRPRQHSLQRSPQDLMATCLIQWLQKLKVTEDPLAAA